MHRSILLLCALVSAACRKEEGAREAAGNWRALTINEAVSADPEQVNEFGDRADWFEIHNPGDPVHLEAGEWFVSDNADEPMKFELPERTVPEQGFLVVWCDGMDIAGEQIHANFSLAAEGERLLLTHRTPAGPVVVDRVDLGAMHGAGGASRGRFPDGAAAWDLLGRPSPGAPNEPVAGN